MTSSNTEIALAFFETLSTEGVSTAIDRFAAADFVWWSAGAGEVQGKIADFMTAFGQQVSGEFRLTIDGTTSEADRVAVQMSLYAELTGDRVYDNRYHFLLEFRGGKIARLSEYHDTRHAYDTIGATLRETGMATP